jgi:hypothetical protein
MAPNPRLEKRLIYSIIGLGIFSLIFGAWQVKQSLAGNTSISKKQQTNATDVTATNNEALKKVDTDQDGLSDYDELNVYHTSPYLEDSDSDGISDKDEVLTNQDPNCPKGQVCTTLLDNSTSGSATSTISTQGLPSTQIPAADPASIKAFLKQNGVTDEQLNSLDDATLLKIREQLIASVQSNQTSGTDLDAYFSDSGESTTATAQTATTATNNYDQLKNLSASQIRDLLKQQGASESLLSKYSDEQLKQVFSQMLQQQSQQKTQ